MTELTESGGQGLLGSYKEVAAIINKPQTQEWIYTSITLDIGRLYRKHIRRQLDKAVYLGRIDSYMESKSFLDSEFLVKGPHENLKIILSWVESINDKPS